MKQEDIYVGTIKKCINVEKYNRYGERQFEGDCQVGSVTLGHINYWAEVSIENAVLIKTKKNNYILLNNIENLKERLLTDLGYEVYPLKTYPSRDGQYFVDKNSLQPYFAKKKQEENIKVKQLKRIVSQNNRNKMS